MPSVLAHAMRNTSVCLRIKPVAPIFFPLRTEIELRSGGSQMLANAGWVWEAGEGFGLFMHSYDLFMHVSVSPVYGRKSKQSSLLPLFTRATDPRVDFASEQSDAYLTRSVIVWTDSVREK